MNHAKKKELDKMKWNEEFKSIYQFFPESQEDIQLLI